MTRCLGLFSPTTQKSTFRIQSKSFSHRYPMYISPDQVTSKEVCHKCLLTECGSEFLLLRCCRPERSLRLTARRYRRLPLPDVSDSSSTRAAWSVSASQRPQRGMWQLKMLQEIGNGPQRCGGWAGSPKVPGHPDFITNHRGTAWGQVTLLPRGGPTGALR